MKLSEITSEMREYNGQVAYGSECNAWQDFVEDTYQNYNTQPWDDKAGEIEVDAEFASYWADVANGNSSDYDENGANA